ncbi:MAG: (4Fe-4S)-binding protein [Bacteroidales bacterium]|nr:(4Fe-4S)-binding protein [Bacteroidales bacterium]
MKDNSEYAGKSDRSYRNDEITVYWKPSACIHASSCYRELIEVFDPGSRPWVNMKGAPNDRIIETVNLCPTEALTWKYNDESRNREVQVSHTNHIKYKRPELYKVPAAEAEIKPLSVRIMPDGPVVVEGTFILKSADGEKHVNNSFNSFCRCGNSKSMPYCDGEHRLKGFSD